MNTEEVQFTNTENLKTMLNEVLKTAQQGDWVVQLTCLLALVILLMTLSTICLIL